MMLRAKFQLLIRFLTILLHPCKGPVAARPRQDLLTRLLSCAQLSPVTFVRKTVPVPANIYTNLVRSARVI